MTSVPAVTPPRDQETDTERIGEGDALAYKDALIHFIATHDDLKEVGRATDVLRKIAPSLLQSTSRSAIAVTV